MLREELGRLKGRGVAQLRSAGDSRLRERHIAGIQGQGRLAHLQGGSGHDVSNPVSDRCPVVGDSVGRCFAPQPAPHVSATEAVIAARIFATLTAAAPSPALQTALPSTSAVAPSPTPIPPTLTPTALPPTPSATAPVAGMVWVPGGEFTMGSDGDPAASVDEKPQHQVYVAGFWISRTEVTNAAICLVRGGWCVYCTRQPGVRPA